MGKPCCSIQYLKKRINVSSEASFLRVLCIYTHANAGLHEILQQLQTLPKTSRIVKSTVLSCITKLRTLSEQGFQISHICYTSGYKSDQVPSLEGHLSKCSKISKNNDKRVVNLKCLQTKLASTFFCKFRINTPLSM